MYLRSGSKEKKDRILKGLTVVIEAKVAKRYNK